MFIVFIPTYVKIGNIYSEIIIIIIVNNNYLFMFTVPAEWDDEELVSNCFK